MGEVLLSIFVVLLFVALNGFFVAAEFAIVKVRATQIEPLVRRGNLRARIAQDIIAHLDEYLSATQLGITMTSLALGWIGEPFVADLLHPSLNALGLDNPRLVDGLAFGVGFSIITILHIVLGEQAPKYLAIQRAQGTALFIAYPLRLFTAAFKPIILGLNGLANGILRLIGIEPAGGTELRHSEEELRLILSQGKAASTTSRAIALNAMDFHRKQARHVMVPRREMFTLRTTDPIQHNLAIMRRNKFSRYPVYRDTADNIIGIVHTKDIFKHSLQAEPTFTLDAIIRDVFFLPETAPLEKVLETMLQKKTHMIILADEYGGTAGLITLENVLEELVGTIQDEYDREPPEVVRVSDTEFLIDGSLTTNDVERLLDRELSVKDIFSIGGFLTEQLGHLPEPGESLVVNNTEFIVEKVEDNAVESVRVRKLEPPPEEEA